MALLVSENAAVLLPALEAVDSLCVDGTETFRRQVRTDFAFFFAGKILECMVQIGVTGQLLSLLANAHVGIVVASIRALRNITRSCMSLVIYFT